MLIAALLLILGVNLIVVVIFGALVIGRRRWLKRQTGWFPGAVRVARGDIDGLGAKWTHGSGRWVRDVLVWSKAPFLFRDELVPVDRISGERDAQDGEVRRLGTSPVVVAFASGDATIEIASEKDMRDRVLGSLSVPTGGRVIATN